MGNVTIINQSIPQINYIARTCTQGEEFTMVNSYIESLVRKYSRFKNKHAAIFIEPQIDMGIHPRQPPSKKPRRVRKSPTA